MAGSRVGDVIASKYRLERLLGSGGMGHVYKAMNVRAGRAVAIKVLRTEHATNTLIVDRFLREAMAANLVRHPNVVDVLDVDKDEDGVAFIVQELLDGEDLQKYVDGRGGRLNIAEVEEYLLPVIDAVAEAHAQGVVHRDIKPENVFLAVQGRKKIPKLLDFGISKVRTSNIKATEVGVMMGTPAYMSPELIQGGSEAHPRADVWALGIMLYELLCGHLPFSDAEAPALFVAIATKDVPELTDADPTIDPMVSRVVGRCLRRNPEDRYPTALELARDLRHVLTGTDIEPTQRRSIPPNALRLDVPFDIPDLALPDVPAFDLPIAKPTEAHGSGEPPRASPHLTQLELASATPGSARGLTSPMTVPAPIFAAPIAPPSRPQLQLQHPASSRRFEAAPTSLEGVMLAGSVESQRRRPAQPYSNAPSRPQQQAQDMGVVVGVGVVALVAIVVTAILTTFVSSPDGWPIVSLFTKPTSLMSLVIHGGFGLVCLIITAKVLRDAFRRWKGDIAGGRGSAVFLAVIAGGLLFAAVQFGRAAF